MATMRALLPLLCIVLSGLGAPVLAQMASTQPQSLAPCPVLGYFRNCYGIYTWYDGSTYEGAWKDNQKTGIATYKDANGDRYVGEWKNNRRHGEGVYTWADGRVWLGEWRDGEPHGRFIQYAPDKSVERMGIFQKGALRASRHVDSRIFMRIRPYVDTPPVVGAATSPPLREEPLPPTPAVMSAVVPASASPTQTDTFYPLP